MAGYNAIDGVLTALSTVPVMVTTDRGGLPQPFQSWRQMSRQHIGSGRNDHEVNKNELSMITLAVNQRALLAARHWPRSVQHKYEICRHALYLGSTKNGYSLT